MASNALDTAANVVEIKLEAAKGAFAEKNLEKYGEARAELEKAVSEYNEVKQKSLYAEFQKSETPFVEFAKAFTYEGKRVTEEKDKEKGNVVGISVTTAPRRLNLKKFVEETGLDSSIISDANKLLQLLVIREKNILTLSHEDFAKQSLFFIATVKKKAAGETPDSNTQICKFLQGIMDKAGISCRVINPDMHYIQQCAFTHDAKGKCRVKAVSPARFQSIIVDVMNHFAEGTAYSVLEKKQSEQQ